MPWCLLCGSEDSAGVTTGHTGEYDAVGATLPLSAGSGPCAAFDGDGMARGEAAVVHRHVDWGNAFVGGYMYGNVQYSEHFSGASDSLLYWKESSESSRDTFCKDPMLGQFPLQARQSLRAP